MTVRSMEDAAIAHCGEHPGIAATFTCGRCGSFGCEACRIGDRCLRCRKPHPAYLFESKPSPATFVRAWWAVLSDRTFLPRLGVGRVGPAVVFAMLSHAVLGVGWAILGLLTSISAGRAVWASIFASACVLVIVPVVGVALSLAKAVVFAFGNWAVGGRRVSVEHFFRANAYVDALAPATVVSVAAVTIGAQHATLWPAAIVASVLALARIRLHALFAMGPPHLDAFRAIAVASLPWLPLAALALLILMLG